jgi:Cd(II)/Pb(II)-responsive transcriptional regulator
MRIGQLAQIAGVDTQTIRFYEKKELLSSPERQENGYRIYTKEHREQLAFIRRCRILGLSLAEIRELLSYRDNPHQPCTAVNAMLDDHISHIRSQMAALEALEMQLVALRKSCNDGRNVKACGVLGGISDPQKW